MPVHFACRNKAISIACIAFASLSANTWLYVSSVVFVVLCPNLSAITRAAMNRLMVVSCICLYGQARQIIKNIAVYSDGINAQPKPTAVYLISSDDLTAVADAIRAKTGGADALSFPEGFVSEIGGLCDTSDATATAGDIAKGAVAYGSSGKATGTVTETKSGKGWICGNPQDAGDTGRLARITQVGAIALRTVDADVLLRAGPGGSRRRPGGSRNICRLCRPRTAFWRNRRRRRTRSATP